MKLVLLPGMDGTGDLFSPLLKALPELHCDVISLPIAGNQSYPALTKVIRDQLPTDDFVLLAESFSGPIAAALAKENIANLKGIIFVATFLSAPKPILIKISQYLPIRLLIGLPLSTLFLKALFLGANASSDVVAQFRATLVSLPPALIKDRLESMRTLRVNAEKSVLPVVYLQPSSDHLVPSNKIIEFTHHFDNILVELIDGPHFILQANSVECAQAITKWITALTTNKNSMERVLSRPASLTHR